MKENTHSNSPNQILNLIKALSFVYLLLMAPLSFVQAQSPNANENATVDGGEITTLDGEDYIEVCVGDGIADFVDVNLEGASGRVKQWIITDDQNNILDLPDSPPFDFDGAPPGDCRIWHLSYNGIKPLVDPSGQGKFTKNLADIRGRFDLSNYIHVKRIKQPVGGEIALADGSTEIEICAGDGESDLFEVTLTGAEGPNMLWVITDTDANILKTSTDNSFDFEDAGSGVCLIWHLSYAENVDLDGVTNANDLMGCFDLSNPITVTRKGVNAGSIEIADGGGTEIEICAGDGESDAFDVTVMGETDGDQLAWVITNNAEDPEILALPAGPPFDLEGAGDGTCLIWHISFNDGLMGAEVGNKVSDLEGCYVLSNAITVIRNGVNAGIIEIADGGGTEVEICAGDGKEDPINVVVTGDPIGDNLAWVITNNAEDPEILALPAGPPFDLEGAGEGTCLIWHISFANGLTGAEVGNKVSALEGCYNLSNAITVVRTGVNGGVISGGEDNTFSFTVGDGTEDKIPEGAITLEGNVGDKSAWVVTNEEGTIILGLPEKYSDVNFDTAEAGTCLVWHMSYKEGLQGLEPPEDGDHLVSGLEGCFSLSNAIKVVRTASASTGKIAIYPNPAKESAQLSIEGFDASELSVSIYNMQNMRLYNADVKVTGLSKRMSLIDVSSYNSGIYFVIVQDENSGVKTISRLVVK
ncbi:T9SS type A sorting domain-containing protein [Tamlana fucoidanivorans]|uniref:T9SS type A sorting domain-containing protein n=1 Tax=Allotamlana fucoidanivorans TaxID=2583814 RepID=A0A5C4SKZ5_9FLAO|nr:T9SS type A sorting domain-containing protein [Tamlana fucoidanivorans]TNJ43797.1 T9SS type A sorting domain-containing protein [Tamlana fucoidanivorans]